jgi:hypothetical protein
MATEDEVDRAVTLPALSESDIGVVLSRDSISKWDMAFASIEKYASNLSLLTSPDQANEFSTATEGLAAELAKLSPNALPSPGVATAFTELGRLLIEAKADSDALRVAQTVDPAMQQIFSTMAAAIGENNQKGIRGTVWEHWQLRMGVRQSQFLQASGDARRADVLAFINLRDQRDAQDLQLGGLRQSILDLGVAHAALARGSNVELNAAIDQIQRELDASKAAFERFSALQPKKEAK